MALDATACLIMEDDLLDFSLVGEDEEDDKIKAPSSSLDYSNPNTQYPDDSFPEFAEEELEWLSNKDAFPSVETCLDILPNPQSVVIPDHQSPISVLENSTSSSNSNITNCCSGFQIIEKCPARARSKLNRKKRKEFPEFLHAQLCWLKTPPQPLKAASSSAVIGRRCQHCLADKTPQWRAGPMGPKTLCNACGVRYKSGRLVPEYRPANSPTFSSVMHSNSHRKIMEMRRHKYVGGGMVVSGSCRYGVGG